MTNFTPLWQILNLDIIKKQFNFKPIQFTEQKSVSSPYFTKKKIILFRLV